MAGWPLEELGGKTTLEAASTPVMDRLAAEAVSLLEQQWNGEQPSADIAVDYCLRSRDSVAPPPRS